MHVPEGYLSTPVTAATAVAAVAGLAWAVRRSRTQPQETEGVPLVGLVAAFVFATQMVNFGVGSGTSGHLMGGALAAVLLGPALAVVCMAGVLGVQAVMFADGGIAALGTNITLMGLVGVAVGWGVTCVVRDRLPATAGGISVASAVGALASVPASALVFTGLYALGGHHDVPLLELAGDMVWTHLLIGLGEAVITAVVVLAVSSSRPDLVVALRRTPVVAA